VIGAAAFFALGLAFGARRRSRHVAPTGSPDGTMS
jgi:hypothetical protein